MPSFTSEFLTGELTQYTAPNWEPLERLVGPGPDAALVLGEIMWMHEIELSDGRSVQAYKHRSTRRYLHLGEDLTAWRFGAPLDDQEPSHYSSEPLGSALRELFATCRELCGDEEVWEANERLIDRYSLNPARRGYAADDGPARGASPDVQ